MNLLALETATRHISVALWRDGAVLSRCAETVSGGSLLVLPWVDDLLVEANIQLSAIQALAVGRGPGSFTGLRLACGVAQGLAFGLELPIIGVGSLAALALVAHRVSGATRIFACLDARMNEVYSACYAVQEGRVSELVAPGVAAPEETRPPSGDWLGCGDAWTVYPQRLPRPPRLIENLWPSAAAVAALAANRMAQGEYSAMEDAQPLYVRDKVALTTEERRARGGVR